MRFILERRSANLRTMDSKKLAQLCLEMADNKKAENLIALDVRKLSSVTDYFVIASGTSSPHVRAIVDEIADKLRIERDLRPRVIDGHRQHGEWIVLDYFDVIVHVMRAEARERYDLEGLWGGAKILPHQKAKPKSPKTPRPKKTVQKKKKTAKV